MPSLRRALHRYVRNTIPNLALRLANLYLRAVLALLDLALRHRPETKRGVCPRPPSSASAPPPPRDITPPPPPPPKESAGLKVQIIAIPCQYRGTCSQSPQGPGACPPIAPMPRNDGKIPLKHQNPKWN